MLHQLLMTTILISSVNSFHKPAALIAGKFLATTFTFAKAESLLKLPDSTEILILKDGDIKSGSGVLRTPTGLFDGSWKNTEMIEGKLKTAAGDIIHLKQPSWASIEYKNGDRYVGDIDRATLLPHEKGYYWRDRVLKFGESYKGMFKAGKYHGKGELTLRPSYGGDLVYTGNFVEGVREGWMTVSQAAWPSDPIRYERWQNGKCVEVVEW